LRRSKVIVHIIGASPYALRQQSTSCPCAVQVKCEHGAICVEEGDADQRGDVEDSAEANTEVAPLDLDQGAGRDSGPLGKLTL